MKRPTIADLAKHAGVSVSTVNRLLHSRGTVRAETVERILDTAQEIGFYGLGALQQRQKTNKPKRTFGFLMQQSHRPIYRLWAESIMQIAAHHPQFDIDARVHFEDDLAPDKIAAHLRSLGEEVDALAIITADHPIISQAIDDLRDKDVPVVTYVTDLSAQRRAGFVGTDNWKVGRTAAWFLSQLAPTPGKIVPLIGTSRYQCQDISDASFRSYLRENAPEFIVGESLQTHEEHSVAYDLVKALIQDEAELTGIFVNGGGISGVLKALRETPEEQRRGIRVVCRDIGPETRKGLTEGLISAALCLPVETMTRELIRVLLNSVQNGNSASTEQRLVPFDVITPESLWT